MANVAKFEVKEDEWGYLVEPDEQFLKFLGAANPVIQVKNNTGRDITVAVEPGVVTPDSSAPHDPGPKGPGKTAVFHLDKADEPANSFAVYVTVDGFPFRARAHSDPRVRPK